MSKVTDIVYLRASDGCKLYKPSDRVLVQSVIIQDGTEYDWIEVTDEEAETLQAEWEKEVMPQDEQPNEA